MKNKYCVKCGSEIKNDNKFCESCGTPIDQNNDNKVENIKETTNNPSTGSNSKEEKLIVSGSLFLIVFLGTIFPYFFRGIQFPKALQLISPISFISGIILIIYGRIKYPHNKVIKSILIVIIILFIMGIIYFIIVAFFLYLMCSTCLSIE